MDTNQVHVQDNESKEDAHDCCLERLRKGPEYFLNLNEFTEAFTLPLWVIGCRLLSKNGIFVHLKLKLQHN